MTRFAEGASQKLRIAGDEEILFDPVTAGFTKLLTQLRVFREAFHRRRQFLGVGWIHNQPRRLVRYGFHGARGAAGDDG